MAIVITDNTSYFSVNSAINVTENYPKNSVAMKRKQDSFIFSNGGDGQTKLFGFDVSQVTTPVHVSVVSTGTFTVDTSITEGVHAQSELTIATGLDGDTVTIGSTVYRFKTTPAQAYDVNLGANDAAALDNFKAAVNASGTGDGTDYFAGTLIHPDVAATTNGATTQMVVARVPGTAANTIATTEVGAFSWDDTTLGGGTGDSTAGVAGDTVTIGTTVYTFVDILTEDHATAIANQVHWVTSDAVALDNFKSAVNLTATQGTDYSTGTVIHPDVTATTNGAATQVFDAKVAGNAGNLIATTETGSTLSWGAATLTGGLDEADVLETALAAIIFS